MDITSPPSPKQDSLSSSSTLVSPSTETYSTCQSSSNSRCRLDLFDVSVKCTSRDVGDDRQCVSHFFGRNKKGTASIPLDYFPVLCRKHYQERYYRWSDDPGLYAGYQCDSILQVLEKMRARSFRDEHGIDWPWYCGVDLRLSQRAEEQQASSAIPEWLRSVCSSLSSDTFYVNDLSAQMHARYSLEQLIEIVKGIKMWCVQDNQHLPCVEALPVTIGMQDLHLLDVARRSLRQSESRRNLAYKARQGFQNSGRGDVVYDQKTSDMLEARIKDAKTAEFNVKLAAMDAAATTDTIPSKRQSNAHPGSFTTDLRSTNTVP